MDRGRTSKTPCTRRHQTLFILGADGTLGRDEFLRLLYGARVSLEVAVLSTIGVMTIGIIMGVVAGYFRGWIDACISRIIEVTMAFPALLFIIALAATIGERLNNITFGVFGKGVVTLVLVFTVFGWFYPARIVRSSVLSLREKEFVEAARMVGASDMRIMRSHVLPHLVAPIVVVSTLIVAQYILAEAGLSFLGLGVKLPTAELGRAPGRGARLLHVRPMADAVAGSGRPVHHPRLQSARRRASGLLRSAFVAALEAGQTGQTSTNGSLTTRAAHASKGLEDALTGPARSRTSPVQLKGVQ